MSGRKGQTTYASIVAEEKGPGEGAVIEVVETVDQLLGHGLKKMKMEISKWEAVEAQDMHEGIARDEIIVISPEAKYDPGG